MAATNMHAKPYERKARYLTMTFSKYINIILFQEGEGGVGGMGGGGNKCNMCGFDHSSLQPFILQGMCICMLITFSYSDTLWKWKAVQRLFDPGKADVR